MDKANLIDQEILTEKYNRTLGINFCNIFLDDMLQKHWGIKLPRVKDTPDYFANLVKKGKNWPQKPMSAALLDDYFYERAKVSRSGVRRVSALRGSLLAQHNIPVVAVGLGHATLSAPPGRQNKAVWPLVFRSDIKDRKERTRVGLKEDSYLKFYALNPSQYKNFDLGLMYSDIGHKEMFDYVRKNYYSKNK